MIDFKTITPSDKPLYEEYFKKSARRGCEFSFLNVFLWGEQKYAEINGCLVLLSQFSDTYYYSYPFGDGDIITTITELIADSKERGIPFKISGMTPAEKAFLEDAFPEKFDFSTTEDSYDYVYAIENLATLSGKKYHGKRNHINKFFENYPDAVTEILSEDNIPAVKAMCDAWFEERFTCVPEHTFDLERAALDRLFANFSKLDAEGMLLKNGNDILAFSVGSPFYEDTFDVHFEKASEDTDGAYPVINREFAKYISEKYPNVKFLDREEDMGLAGLRQAKLSYRPIYMVEKWRCKLR
ncbi:MAG: DUF2156 domain-containing protein [Clostridia bacterium]|nr:DUF2156 domain-containing protein [Clostridia bacterium]